VPVLLSVGYSACHWCHVMAHESFEDPQTAALMNENLVAIKVDREERPDVDAVYMTATQAMTGQGGWPMTVFMTPDRDPFFCGTYFPRSTSSAWSSGWPRRGGRTGTTSPARPGRSPRRWPSGPHRSRGWAWTPVQPGGAAGDLAGVCDQAVVTLAGNYDKRAGGFRRGT